MMAGCIQTVHLTYELRPDIVAKTTSGKLVIPDHSNSSSPIYLSYINILS